MSAGRQLVDGVSGARPGSRPPARGAGRRSSSLPRLDELGRWVEDKLDWILEDEDDWREPWQEQRSSSRSDGGQPQLQRRRRPLEAISRRSLAPQPSAAPQAAVGDWPDDEAFTVARWQRPTQPERSPLEPAEAMAPTERAESSARPLPRSTRRRSR